jgi:hypothetical protein
MRSVLKFSCGCEIAFSDSYHALIVVYECEKHKSGKEKSKFHFILSCINGLLALMESDTK